MRGTPAREVGLGPCIGAHVGIGEARLAEKGIGVQEESASGPACGLEQGHGKQHVGRDARAGRAALAVLGRQMDHCLRRILQRPSGRIGSLDPFDVGCGRKACGRHRRLAAEGRGDLEPFAQQQGRQMRADKACRTGD